MMTKKEISNKKISDQIKALDQELANLEKLKKSYDLSEPINSIERYKAKKKLVILINKQIKKIGLLKAKIAKLKVMTASDLFDVIKNMENDQIDCVPLSIKLRNKMIQNAQIYNILLFEKEVWTNAKKGNCKFISTNAKSINKRFKKIDKDIGQCQKFKSEMIKFIKEIVYAKLVKNLDKLNKNEQKTKKTRKQPKDLPYVVVLKDVSKYYYNKWLATKVLKEVNLKIKHGEFVVILGPSGSGKTTLLNLISGLDNPTYGEIIVNGHNLSQKSDAKMTKFRKDNIGFIFQQYGLLPNLTVRENIEIGWQLQKNVKKRSDIDTLLSTIKMSEHAHKFPSELSGGQQQRVSIARSLAKNPAIIFADEPTGAVDEEMAKQILQLFVDINKKFHTTIIMITHNNIFTDLATRVIKVNSGRIISDKVNKHPKSVNELQWNKQ